MAPTAVESDTNQIWEELLRTLLELIRSQLNCNMPPLPADIPVAMAMVVDCYATGGLANMTFLEELAFLLVLDDTEKALRNAPAGFPSETLESFGAMLDAMRSEVLGIL